MISGPETVKENPNELTALARERLSALQVRLAAESGRDPFAALALNRLRTVTDRKMLAREIADLQGQREYASMADGLRNELQSLQAEVETMTEKGARALEQNVLDPLASKTKDLPGWARFTVAGLSIGAMAYGVWNFMTKTLKSGKDAVVAGAKKTGGFLSGFMRNVALMGAGVLGYNYFFKKEAPKEGADRA